MYLAPLYFTTAVQRLLRSEVPPAGQVPVPDCETLVKTTWPGLRFPPLEFAALEHSYYPGISAGSS